MRRWRAALEPLFRSRRTSAPGSTKVISVASEPRPPPADARDACQDELLRLPLRERPAVDLVVGIDTSGSMHPELREVVRWLTNLELALRRKESDFQLLVVADHGRFRGGRTALELDAGRVDLPIGSRDAFETLIRSAREGPEPRWPQRLRPGSAKHLVVVTDDEAADPQGLAYLPALTKASGISQLTVHLLGGFDAEQLLEPGAPLATWRCPLGQAPGLAYQKAAQQTGGLRASLCSPRAQGELADRLAAWRTPAQAEQCLWLLPSPGPELAVDEVRAQTSSGGVLRLSEAHTTEACSGRPDGWRATGRLLALCQSTCAALREAGVTEVQVRVRCR